MDVQVELTGRRIDVARARECAGSGQVGAWAEFAGVVRELEDGTPIAALEYEAYESMALRVMREILMRLGRHHPCECVRVIHRVGIVPVGDMAIWIRAGAVHRREALALVTAFMDELKQDVPIWKCRSLGAEELKAVRDLRSGGRV